MNISKKVREEVECKGEKNSCLPDRPPVVPFENVCLLGFGDFTALDSLSLHRVRSSDRCGRLRSSDGGFTSENLHNSEIKDTNIRYGTEHDTQNNHERYEIIPNIHSDSVCNSTKTIEIDYAEFLHGNKYFLMRRVGMGYMYVMRITIRRVLGLRIQKSMHKKLA
ncbi:hypothetical protein Bhyg_13111 [Pseudolycoriella hygida]|uniref:Uncharacterized protein n=1 Tax=Pseudolycoriella hygida TaxID=35572 RepID=A0A9Q0MYU7_9DIPT|nr:hypothetical protein Bhyg_13111 [Pseudolycoriella hygida]